MGGLRMVPDMILDDLDPADSNLLILPGADMWDAGGRDSVRRGRRALPGRRSSRGGHLRCHGWPRPSWSPGQPPPHQRCSRVPPSVSTPGSLEAAQVLAANGGLTAAWWQVLGGIVDQPRTVSEIVRRMGMTLQGVQRVADLLVAHHLAEYRPNPAHRRAKLLACTEAGDWAIRRISFVAHPFSNRIGAQLATDELRNTLMTMRHLVALLEADQLPPND
jgi:DNA-binding MarR family transcriptional regulator